MTHESSQVVIFGEDSLRGLETVCLRHGDGKVDHVEEVVDDHDTE